MSWWQWLGRRLLPIILCTSLLAVVSNGNDQATAAISQLDQSEFRWYQNTDAIQPTTGLAAQNTLASIPNTSTITRLRANLRATGTMTPANSQRFALQYGTSTSGPWTNVTSSAAWWNSSWSNRRKVVFNNADSSSTLTDFPVLVSVDSSKIDYAKTQNAGQDIRFVSSSGAQLSYEIETWDESGTSSVWVKVPSIAAGSTSGHIWMYYGNAAAPDAQSANSVWDTGFAAVLHLKENGNGTAGEYIDSTSNANHGRGGGGTSGNVPPRASGKIGFAPHFDGSTDFIDIGSGSSLDNLGTFTYEAWVNLDTFGETGHGRIFEKSNLFYSSVDNDATYIEAFGLYRARNSTNQFVATNNNTLNLSNWRHISVVVDGTTSTTMYVDGVETGYSQKILGAGTPQNDSAASMLLGNRPDGNRAFDGRLDEFRMSNTVRSPDWVKANYLSQNNQFNTFGLEESNTGWRYHDNPTPADGATTSSTLLTSSTTNGAYSESNLTTLNPNALNIDSYSEWDFALDPAMVSVDAIYFFRIVEGDGAPLTTYTRYPALNLGPALDQEAYRWFANAASTDVGSPLAATSTVATAPVQGTPFRLRTAVYVTNRQFAIGNPAIKLQYALRSGSCDASFAGETYTDVSPSSGAIRFHNGTPADGATATANANDPNVHAKIMQTYEEANNATTVAAVAVGQDGIWDASLVDFSASASTTYCFRLVRSDGTLFETYSAIAELTTNAGNTAPNTPVDLAQTKTNTTPIPANTLYNFDAGTQGWLQGNDTMTHETGITRTGSGAIRISTADGITVINDGQSAARDLTSGGPVFSTWVYFPSSNTGTDWRARIQVQDAADDTFEFGTFITLDPNAWTLVTYAPAPEVLANMKRLRVHTTSTNATGTNLVYVDDFQQGNGIKTDETSVRFTATVADADNPDTSALCVEAKPVGTAFSGTEDSCGSSVSYTGTPLTATHTLSGFTDGMQYHWQARVRDTAGVYSPWVAYGGNKDTVTASPDFEIQLNRAPDTPTALAQTRADTTNLATGAWHNSTTIRFTATVSDPDNPSALQLCVEAKSIGSAFTNSEDSCGTAVMYSGTGVTAVHSLILADATQYHWQVRVIDAGGLYSPWTAYGGNSDAVTADRDIGIDTTAPTDGTVYDGASAGVDAGYNDGSLSSLSANWAGYNTNVSGLARYEYQVGTTPGGSQVRSATSVGTATSVTASSLVLQTSVVYYFTVTAYDNAGNLRAVTSNGQYVAPTLSFSVSSSTIDFEGLNSGNGYTSTRSLTTTTSTNAYGGYVIRQSNDSVLTDGSKTISAYEGTWASPTAWTGTGFGYTSDDTSIQETGNKFGSGTRYAGLTTSLPGDIVADHVSASAGTPIVNRQFTISYRVTVAASQPSGNYNNVINLGATALY